MDKYCMMCGTELIDGVCPKCIQSDAMSEGEHIKFSRFFMSPNEKFIVALGNSYIENFISSGITEKGFAVVSDKRVYFQGTSYNVIQRNNGKNKLVKVNKSRTVNLDDVTGVGVDSSKNILWKILEYLSCIVVAIIVFFLVYYETNFENTLVYTLVTFVPFVFAIIHDILEKFNVKSNVWKAVFIFVWIVLISWIHLDILSVIILNLIPSVLMCICFFVYQKSKKALIVIQYAGGRIGFDKKWFIDKEIEQFQKLLYLAKDKGVAKKDAAISNQMQEAMSSITMQSSSSTDSDIVSKLEKAADMLSKGIISQEEFEKIKKGLF